MSTQLQQARESLAKGDQALAQALAAAVLQEEPQNGEAWFLLSEATDGERKAIFLKKASKLAPDNKEIQARLHELTAPSSPPVVTSEPEPQTIATEAESWDDFDMLALADEDDDGEPIDTSAIMVDEPPAPRPAVQEKVKKPTAVDEAVAEARAFNVSPQAPASTPPKPTEEESQPGPDWNYIGMIGFAVLAIVLLLLAVWLAVS